MRCCLTSTRPAWAAACSLNCSVLGRWQIKDYYAELPIAIRVTGRYHDVGSFAADVANLSRIVTLQNMSHHRRSGHEGFASRATLAMEATARTYRYLDATEIAEQRKGARRLKTTGAPQMMRHAAHQAAQLLLAACLLLAGLQQQTTTSSVPGWSSSAARPSPTCTPLQAPKKFDPAALRGRRRPWNHSAHQKLSVALKQESEAAEFPDGGRD